MEAVVGIDPSLTGTAVCVMRRDGSCQMSRFTSKPAEGVSGRVARYAGLVRDVASAIQELPNTPVVCIEGYSFGSNGRSMLDLAEYGGLLRQMLVKFQLDGGCAPPIEIPPHNLKKFATGKGNGDKLAVCLAIQKRYDVTFETNDEYDAYVLARIAGCKAGWWEPETAAQREALTPKSKAKKPRKSA